MKGEEYQHTVSVRAEPTVGARSHFADDNARQRLLGFVSRKERKKKIEFLEFDVVRFLVR